MILYDLLNSTLGITNSLICNIFPLDGGLYEYVSNL